MPELPEVETIRRHLAPLVEGRRLERVEVLDPRWCRPLDPGAVGARLTGRTIERLGRRGKYFVFELSGGLFLLWHLRMTGALLYDPEPAPPPHTRVTIDLDDGHELVFTDPRRFGTGELAADPGALDAFFAARLGVEPLGPDFTYAYLRALAKTSRAPIKPFLLDQKRIAGVGNIYADEALFRARIHPLREARRVRPVQLDDLRDAVVEVLELGIGAGGASIDDYRNPAGVEGAFQNDFLIHLREGLPCVRCGTPVRKLVVGGRGTYVCESCQIRPRRTPR